MEPEVTLTRNGLGTYIGGIMIIHYHPSKKERFKNNVKHFIYVINSYLKLEPCGYCGKANNPEIICYKCYPKS